MSSRGRALRVGILRSCDANLAHGEARDALAVTSVADAARGIEDACRANGWIPLDLEASPNPSTVLFSIEHRAIDVIVNLAESIRGEARLEAAAAWLFEWARIPFTGSGGLALSLALDKPLARAALSSRGVPVPAGFVVTDATAALPAEFGHWPGARWIVKPSREDASHGIDIGSVVTSARDLRTRCAYVLERYRQPALVEEFIEGREFNVAVIGTGAAAEVLPLAEIDFSAFPAGKPQLVTFDAKWNPDSPDYQGTPSVAALPMDPALEAAVRTAALAAYDALGLAGYGRIDLRVHPELGPLVLDVNPNPDISPDAGFCRAAARGGLDHADLLARIVDAALERAGRGTARSGAH